jgi:hypothetical protein
LEGIVREIEPLARKHKTWFRATISARGDGDRIREAARTMDEALKKFSVRITVRYDDTVAYESAFFLQTSLQIETYDGVAGIQKEQKSMRRELSTRVLDLQGNQAKQMENIRIEQQETKKALSEAGEI